MAVKVVQENENPNVPWVREITMEVSGEGIYIEIVERNGEIWELARFDLEEVKAMIKLTEQKAL